MAYPEPLEALIAAFERYPGIGRRSAERLAFHALRDREARGLAQAIERAFKQTVRCSVCANVAEQDPCRICADPKRDDGLVAVVEEPRHVEAMERSGAFHGRYHVLMGAWNAADGTDPEHLTVKALVDRLRAGGVRELILATDPDAEGEATGLLVAEAVESAIHPAPLITRLARGVPAGSSLEYLHRGILEDALEARRPIGPPRGRS